MTETRKHTPGPWMVRTGAVYQTNPNGWEDGGDEHYPCIARMDRDEPSTRPIERDANARLIASAPELLRSLQRLIHPMASDDDVDNARAVIAKALGDFE